MIDKTSGLTETEQKVADLLRDAWNAFSLVPVISRSDFDDLEEFRSGIHRLQDILASKVVRRDYPEYWL